MATDTEILEKEAAESVMGRLLAEHEELVSLPRVGDIVNGVILEKTSNSMYLDLGALGVGVIYGRELFDDMDSFESTKIGDTIQAKIQQLDNEDGMVELSLRSATRERSWEELRRKMSQEEIFETEVLDANKGGLIVRVNGVTGFLPVSQLAPDHYPRVEGADKSKIYDRLKEYVGQMFKVKIINASKEDEKLIVSEKAAVSAAMGDVLTKLGEGKIVEGEVSGVVDFGAFIKFAEGGQELEGLVHISELAWQRIDNPSDFVSVGEKIKAKVIGVDQGLRISLSIKQLQEDPWSKVGEKYNLGDKVEGEVFKVTPFGGFVKLDKHIHGLIHVSELPEGSQQDVNSILKIGEKMKFTIISLDAKEHRLGLSLRTSEKKDTAARPTKPKKKMSEKEEAEKEEDENKKSKKEEGKKKKSKKEEK